MKARRFAWVLWLLVGCGDVFEDERSCTAVGCANGFSITGLASEGLPDGDYEIQLTLDGVLVSCSHPAIINAPRPTGTCNARNVRSNVVVHNGGVRGTGAANGFLIDIVDTPSLVLMRVLHAGELVAEGSYEPAYRTTMPNGPECGPTCNTAPPAELRLDLE